MSSTNCFLPSNGFCLNLRVRMVNSLIVDAKATVLTVHVNEPYQNDLEPKWLEP